VLQVSTLFFWSAVSWFGEQCFCFMCQTFLAFSSVIQEGSPSLLGLGFEVSELMMEGIDIWC